jgi:uncharacterized protein
MAVQRTVDLRTPSSARDDAALLALNNAFRVETSELSLARLRQLIAEAFMARAIGRADALLIAFDQDADYDSRNFIWFKQRLDRFVYIDRIIVATAAQSRGLAGILYRELFAACRRSGHTHVVCEVNFAPPNPASDAFHAKLGFTEMGRAALEHGKIVRYLSHDLGVPTR